MINFIENKCYEVVRQMEWCDICEREFLKAVEHIDVATPDTLVRLAVKFMYAKERCEYTYTLVHQFIWATKDETYKDLWDYIVGGYEEKKWT